MSVKSVCMCLVLFTLSRKVLSVEIPICQDSNNTAKSCCPCFQEMMINCNTTCPDEYKSINVTANSVTCKNSTSTTPSVTMTTPVDVTMETENTTLTQENTTKSVLSIAEEYTIVCWKSCPEHQWYDNRTMQCLKCNEKCLSCYWPDRNNCTVCSFEFNETCYAKCPKGMVASKTKTENDPILCEIKSAETEDKKLYVIIGAAAGGGVIVIIIVIIVCCCCCHHRRNQNISGSTERRAMTRMSVLLETQQTEDAQGRDKKPAGRPRGYENVSNTQPSSTEIQRQGDNVLRYTKDPTVKEKTKQNEETTDEESPYGNIAMVNLAKKTDLTHTKGEKLKEMLELEELEEAPKAPTLLPVSTAKKKRKEKSVPVTPAHVPIDYIDMSGSPKGSVPSTEPNTTGVNLEHDAGLEDYENINYSQIPQGRKAAKRTGHETSQEDGLEVYENAPVAQSDNVKGDNSDLEDYENTKELHIKGSERPKGKQKPKEDDDKDLEDYENMKDMDLELYENTQFQNK
ncbi:uncharacterized protein LOC123540183 isoform X2 [Mercenaria mercenaria]|uniref:uncharacterized protein LOC123540183 isoform X2 n=1 Tax=Mercenaria mercenaria TaxID=6596 RepID=UPI00234E9C58|nr:uncharacterized protein LOC123540183 isoform X2 [Mercenaria mercenaria]